MVWETAGHSPTVDTIIPLLLQVIFHVFWKHKMLNYFKIKEHVHSQLSKNIRNIKKVEQERSFFKVK